jgi:hypothetical protein
MKGNVSMIIQTGMRTDIPAFYSDWFANRLREGFVLVRNPYNPSSVTRYDLNPDVVDMIGFCSKNPAPMLKYMDLLKPYGQYWFVTITPYGKEIEPNVPDKDAVIAAFCRMSEIVGVNSMGWRYDPILIDQDWTAERHIEAFAAMADSEGLVYFAAETGKQMNSELQIRVTNYEGGLIFILSHSAVRL